LSAALVFKQPQQTDQLIMRKIKFPIQIPINEKEVMVLYPVHFFVAFTLVVCFAVIVYVALATL